MVAFFCSGLFLGLSAGLSPGPLLALVLSETLKHDAKAGIKVALAPVITDLPIILLTVFILSRLSQFNAIMAGISFLGCFLLLYMGMGNLRTTKAEIHLPDSTPKPLLKGIAANALSPHPYLFWLSVGAPITVKAMSHSIATAATFLIGFYFALVGSKITLAIVVNRYKSFMSHHFYIYTLRGLGLLLIVFGGILFYEGIKVLF